jgi:hypothetical protein
MPPFVLVPCLDTYSEDYGAVRGGWSAGCALLEGYTDEQHSHWLDATGREWITRHRDGERQDPSERNEPAVLRRIGR